LRFEVVLVSRKVRVVVGESVCRRHRALVPSAGHIVLEFPGNLELGFLGQTSLEGVFEDVLAILVQLDAGLVRRRPSRLSGLGRAFIYAGARSLLVSHWAVYSEATVKLITGAVDEMTSDAKVGRAEAMRRSMLVHRQGNARGGAPGFLGAVRVRGGVNGALGLG